MNFDRNLTGIVIDPGHGGVDSGAVGNGLKEKDLTLSISKYMYDRFRELGIPVALTRDSDTTLTSDNRPGVALSKFGNDKDVIIISNHINAGGGEGAEVIYALRNNDILSRMILNKLGEKGQLMRKNYQRRLPSDMTKDYYYILRNTPNSETVIVEYGFIDNVRDSNKLRNNYKDYADAVIEAVLEYKNISTNEPNYYIVKKGDSLWSIAKKYNTTVNELKEINNLVSNTLTIGQKLKLKEEVNNDTSIDIPNIYVVEKGDTLYSIANNFNTSVSELKKINNLISNTLSIGQILLINDIINEPSIEDNNYDYYTIKKGDTLYSLSKKYNISVDELKNLNNLSSNILSVGTLLKVPLINNIYIVKKGDTLWSIANDNNTTVNNLKEINNLTSNTLSIGQELKLS